MKHEIEGSLTSSEKTLELVRLINRHLLEGVPVPTLAHESGRSERSIWRLIKKYRSGGIDSLERKKRADNGISRKISDDVRLAIEGLCLKSPRASLAWIHRQVSDICRKDGLPIPSYTTVYNIFQSMHPHMKTLALEGERVYKQTFEIIHRMEAARPNEMWQCDHTQLDLYGSDWRGRTGKVWLTAIIDDYSRAVPGYYIGIEPPNSMRVALSLRQGIWHKDDPAWLVCGIPESVYTDRGTDFKSTHMEQVALDLGIQLHKTDPHEPQGRGKIERFFGTVDNMFCPGLLSTKDKPLDVQYLDKLFRDWLIQEYLAREHSETGDAPLARWKAGKFTPRLPDSLKQLDLMLHKVAESRKVRRDGIRFETFRYFDLALADYVGDEVAIRYDPRDLSKIFVFADKGFLCEAICAELAGRQVTLEEIIRERRRRKKEIREAIQQRIQAAESWINMAIPVVQVPPPVPPKPNSEKRIKRYIHE